MQQSLGCGNVQCTCPQQGALSPLRLVDIISSHVYSILIYASALPHQQGAHPEISWILSGNAILFLTQPYSLAFSY